MPPYNHHQLPKNTRPPYNPLSNVIIKHTARLTLSIYLWNFKTSAEKIQRITCGIGAERAGRLLAAGSKAGTRIAAGPLKGVFTPAQYRQAKVVRQLAPIKLNWIEF